MNRWIVRDSRAIDGQGWFDNEQAALDWCKKFHCETSPIHVQLVTKEVVEERERLKDLLERAAAVMEPFAALSRAWDECLNPPSENSIQGGINGVWLKPANCRAAAAWMAEWEQFIRGTGERPATGPTQPVTVESSEADSIRAHAPPPDCLNCGDPVVLTRAYCHKCFFTPSAAQSKRDGPNLTEPQSLAQWAKEQIANIKEAERITAEDLAIRVTAQPTPVQVAEPELRERLEKLAQKWDEDRKVYSHCEQERLSECARQLREVLGGDK